MPVILGNKQAVDDWLKGDISRNSLQALTQPYEHQDLVWYPVTPAMGKISYDGPECVKQLKIGAESKNSIVQLFGKQKHSVQPSSKEAKTEPSAEEDAKHLDIFLMDEKELKAFLAGLEPDVDITKRETNCKTENEEETEGRCVVAPDKKPNIMSQCDISPGFEQTKTTSGKGLKKRKSPESSPKLKTQAATTGIKEGQRSLLNFFGKQ